MLANNEGNTGAIMEKISIPGQDGWVTMSHPHIHYENIMRAFGGDVEHMDRPEEVIPALQRAAASVKPGCVNVQVDPNTPYPSD